MVESSTREAERRRDVGRLEIGQLLNDLSGGETGREQVEDVDDANAHAPDARLSPALIGVYRDPVHQFNGLSHGVLTEEGSMAK